MAVTDGLHLDGGRRRDRAPCDHLVERVPVYQWHADLRRGLLLEQWAQCGLLVHQSIVWVKDRAVLTRSDLMWQHEPCLFGWFQGMRPPSDRRAPAAEPLFVFCGRLDADGEPPGRR